MITIYNPADQSAILEVLIEIRNNINNNSNCNCDMCCTNQLSGYITPVVETPALHYTANPVGGSAPYVYEWDVAQNYLLGGTIELPTIAGATNLQTVELTDEGVPSNVGGLIRCKITDNNGNVTFAYYQAVINQVAP